ncbi:NAD-dependent epimerase/dehydratase family protein [Nocardia sp. Marseille-Q1738]
MRVVLAGATGTLGSELLPLLLAAGHSVTALTRSTTGARRVRRAGASALVVDVMDRQALLRAVDGRTADAVIHQATALSTLPRRHRDLYATDALREEGTANLLRAAEELGARRFVTQSFFLGYGYHDHGDEPVTEEAPFAPPARGEFERHARSMRANEQQVRNAHGIEGIALRYGLFYGPEPSTRTLMDMARARRLPIVLPGGTTSPIHIADAAAATVAALEHGRPGAAYNIADDHPLPFAEYVQALAAAAAAPPPLRVPALFLRPLPYMYALMVRSRIRLSNAKAKDELAWTPQFPSVHDGLAAMTESR